jgi:hypothetical protein
MALPAATLLCQMASTYLLNSWFRMENRRVMCEKQKNVAGHGNGKKFLLQILNGFVPAI